MRIVFFGSDEFAATSLEHLLKSSHQVVGAVTQPDTRQGRGMKLALSPIKVLAQAKGIDYIQPATLKSPDVVKQLKEFNADLFVVVAYGRLLTQEILDIPKVFCVNVHGSLLPKYRGAAPINWAILNGDKQTGVTVQKMALALDAGDIIAQAPMPISFYMTADILRSQMADCGAKLLVNTIDAIETKKFILTPQDPAEVSFAPRLTREMARIDWQLPAEFIYNQIRGLKPWPGTYALHQGKPLKILKAAISSVDHHKPPGTILTSDKTGFTVACGVDSLLVQEVQPEAGKAMSAASYVSGHSMEPSEVLP